MQSLRSLHMVKMMSNHLLAPCWPPFTRPRTGTKRGSPHQVPAILRDALKQELCQHSMPDHPHKGAARKGVRDQFVGLVAEQVPDGKRDSQVWNLKWLDWAHQVLLLPSDVAMMR
ncbi:hypothetical protein BRADI_3g44713v3 [Brachypodium distachyon]|uniref:Uncharacterized protein n=1 Tax=Brachypodium distachyon TaxID=15368 RepID=A0A2K2D373_BRADI|nr:hypothetical protein BRADI_3g44713v3 [Brachypodium distachyon]